MNATIGVDISKDHLDLHRLPDGATKRFTNNARGHRQLVAWLAGDELDRIVYEATGHYHRSFESALAQAGLPLAKVNPRQARRFAEAFGALAKSDRIDAAMLAEMGRRLQPDIREPASQALNTLRDLQSARRALIKDRTAAKNRLARHSLDLLKAHTQARLEQIAQQIADIDRLTFEMVSADPLLKRRFDLLTSIPGISKTTACIILSEMPELGNIQARQAASLAGLAPFTKQSGAWSGKARIRAGRRNLRYALYMPALVASRFNPDLKATYDKLCAAGKPFKVAITAVMRKLLILANAIIRKDTPWAPVVA